MPKPMISIVSGYFDPFHVGHLRLFQSAKAISNRLVVIVNNDKQQLIKKGGIVIGQKDRIEIVEALRVVDETILSIDKDTTVCATLEHIAKLYPDDELIFANGGDRNYENIAESVLCERLGIKLMFGVGE